MSLLKIVRSGNEPFIAWIIEEHALNGDQLLADDDSLFSAACSNRLCNVATLLLRRGKVNVNFRHRTFRTPLMKAVWNRDRNMVELLLGQPDINVNATDAFHETAVYDACKRGEFEIFCMLLWRPETKIRKKNLRGQSLRDVAIEMRDIRFINELRHRTRRNDSELPIS